MPSSDELLAALKQLHPKSIDMSLDRLEALLIKCGSPERLLQRPIHVAGTNGKGSTIAFLRAGLEADGQRVHAYTSPHLVRFHERIRLGASGLISEAELAALLTELLQINAGEQITFFEATTCAAMLAFSRSPADYTILEVGMGGRTDATNVANLAPSVCVITPVSLDHQAFLGDTVGAIAGEKAGILRGGVPAVVARQHPDAMHTIRTRAAEIGCPLLVCGEDWDVREESVGGNGPGATQMVYRERNPQNCGWEEIVLPVPSALHGAHQLENAGCAIAVLRLLDRASARALEGAVRDARWAGRLQRLDHGPLSALAGPRAELWLDGGHNPAAGMALSAALSRLDQMRRLSGTAFVCAMLRTKDVHGFLSPLRALGGRLYALPIPSEGSLALDASETAEAARAVGFEAVQVASPLEAVRAALAAVPEATAAAPLRIVICGSLYLAGWVLQENGSTDAPLTQAPSKL